MIYAIKEYFPNLTNSGDLLLIEKNNLITILIRPGLKSTKINNNLLI